MRKIYGITRQRIIRTLAVAAAGAVLTGGAFLAPSGSSRGTSNAAVASDGVAGVSASLSAIQLSEKKVSGEATDVSEVGSTENEAAETASVQYPDWASRLMANVEDSLNVRDAASETGAVLGKLRKGDVAEIVSEADGWYQITSGNLTGYVRGDYVVTGDDAKALADQVCPTTATVTSDGLNLRKEASDTAAVATALYKGDTMTVRTGAEVPDGWTAVSKNGVDGYVASQYVTVSQQLGTGITNEEEAAAIAAQKKAEEEAAAKKAAEEAKKAAEAARSSASQVTTTQQAAYAASADDVTLLAAIIQHEAGNEIYEGQVAVGSVVMNRVRSGRYPNTVRGVLFQSGQFTSEAALSRVIAGGLKSSCVSAAQEALAGADVVGGRVSFRPVSSGRSGLVIGNHVFF